MKRENIFRNLFALVFAAFISFLTLRFVLPTPEKFMFINERTFIAPKGVIDFCDLDGNGRSERIVYMPDAALSNILVYLNYKMISRWTCKGLVRMVHNTIGDFDSNGSSEIYVFSYFNDSIFLHILDPFGSEEKFLRESIFVDRCLPYKGQAVYSIVSCGFHDLNGDGFRELLFAVNAGHACQPRALYAYDTHEDSLYRSQPAGTGLQTLTAADLDNDGMVEFMGETAGGNSCRDDTDYKDSTAWLMVFDNTLGFKFAPVAVGSFSSVLTAQPCKPGRKSCLATLHKYSGAENMPSEVMLWDIDGNLLRHAVIKSTAQVDDVCLICSDKQEGNRLFIIYPDGEVNELDSNLSVISAKKINGIRSGQPVKLDLDGDNRQEYLFPGARLDEIIVTDHGFRRLGKVNIHDNRKILHASVLTSRDEENQLFIQCEDQAYYFSLQTNVLYYYRYAVMGFVCIIILLIVFFFQQMQFRLLDRRIEKRRRITELQMKAIKNQVDPHFTFNILNTLGSLFLQKEPEKADYLFGKYARLLRNTLSSSDKFSVTLAEEMENVTHFLDLEKHRMEGRLDYSVQADPGVDFTRKIPKTIIQTFVENALKHGIKHKAGKGLVTVSVKNDHSCYVIEVTDNGIGRARASAYSGQSTGKGLIILDEILALYRQIENVRITYRMHDATNENDADTGTRVIITIPIK